MGPQSSGVGWEVASWAIVLFLVWGGFRFFQSAREIHREKKYAHPAGRVFSELETRRVVLVHVLFGVVALLGAALAAVGLIFW